MVLVVSLLLRVVVEVLAVFVVLALASCSEPS
jgi:hypothetical protein